MEIYLIRHTTPAIPKGLIYGRLDVPLCKKSFLIEKKQIIEKIEGNVEIVYSSPSTRCILLANELSENVVVDERLYEYNFGSWEGKSWDSLSGNEVESWMCDFVNVCPPQGEMMVHMNDRVTDFWNHLLLLPRNFEKIAIITHGGVVRLIKAKLDGIPLNEIFKIKVGYGDILRLEIK